jgi:hypothetical protein
MGLLEKVNDSCEEKIERNNVTQQPGLKKDSQAGHDG